MIDVKDVRIGIWLKWKDNDQIFDVMNGMMLSKHFWNHIHEGDIMPIPLTPDILEKCGFEYEDMGDDSPYERWICKEYKELWVWNFNDEEWMFCLGDAFEQGGFHHLHQLQNVYHSLTQQELQINF